MPWKRHGSKPYQVQNLKGKRALQLQQSEALFRSGYNAVLQSFAQVDKIGAVPRDPDNELRMVFGVFLGVKQCLFVKHIELNMAYTEISPGSQIMVKKLLVFTFKELRQELLIQKLLCCQDLNVDE